MDDIYTSRRRALKMLGLLGMGAIRPSLATDTRITLAFENGSRDVATFPGKRPLIVLTHRPPQLETPFSVFNEGLITPNDAFFVRYHWSAIPISIDTQTFRLKVRGNVGKPLELTLDALKKLGETVETTAINQCSGNSRAHFSPRVSGGQLHHGAMGNARWTGIPLKNILDAAGVTPRARQVVFNGLDRPPLATGPDFIKALDIDHARDGEVMVAWAMNGQDLPLLNGYPLRLVVPGYYGTYWVKHLDDIEVIDHMFDGFWMSKAYRVAAPPHNQGSETVPISRMNVRSFVTNLSEGSRVNVGQRLVLRGIAFDGGAGIASVAVSTDDQKTWQQARLGKETGRYGFHEWTMDFLPGRRGVYRITSRARNRAGEQQPMKQPWNAQGYRRNVAETISVVAE